MDKNPNVLTVKVTNSTDARRLWNIEPYGDEIWLSPADVLRVEFECSIDVVLEITLHPGDEVMWADFAGATAVPETLTLNGRSLWPS